MKNTKSTLFVAEIQISSLPDRLNCFITILLKRLQVFSLQVRVQLTIVNCRPGGQFVTERNLLNVVKIYLNLLSDRHHRCRHYCR